MRVTYPSDIAIKRTPNKRPHRPNPLRTKIVDIGTALGGWPACSVPRMAHQLDAWLTDFESALAARDIDRAVAQFVPDSIWRDLVSFTWNITTVEGQADIADMLHARLTDTGPSGFRISETPVDEGDGVTSAFIEFETAVGRGVGHLRLKDGLGWTLLTALDELKGYEEAKGFRRPLGAVHGPDRDGRSWADKRAEHDAALGYSQQPYVVVVGGGQGGIALGARLRQLGVPAIVIDKHARPGDHWRKRYKTLCLHDPVWYDHFPYLPFPANWPVFSPKDKIADWLEFYTRVMEIPYWTSTTCVSASFDAQAKQWTVEVDRDGERLTLRPTHLVLATGMAGKPNVPDLPGQQVFRGEQHHSSQHPGPDGYVGKRAVVIGSGTSAHDICKALYENDVDVTMVQRASTLVVTSDAVLEIALGALYSEQAAAAGITTEQADLTAASLPYRLTADFQKPISDAMRLRDKDLYDRLERAGFRLDFGDDDSGQFMKYLRRGGGFYIDVGASDLICDGSIKLCHGAVQRMTEESVILDDGTELPADLVVYATGFRSMNSFVADLIGQDVADKVGKVWGLGSGTTQDPGPWEGELRNMWKPTQQENLWFHGGNLHQSRHYSLFLGLQLKARYEGIPTPVYGLPQVHHLS